MSFRPKAFEKENFRAVERRIFDGFFSGTTESIQKYTHVNVKSKILMYCLLTQFFKTLGKEQVFIQTQFLQNISMRGFRFTRLQLGVLVLWEKQMKIRRVCLRAVAAHKQMKTEMAGPVHKPQRQFID